MEVNISNRMEVQLGMYGKVGRRIWKISITFLEKE